MVNNAENFLVEHGRVNNREKCIEMIMKLSGSDSIDFDYIKSFSENVLNGVIYLDRELNEVSEDKADFKWVNIGYKRFDHNLYAQFKKTNIGWIGAFIGTRHVLKNNIENHRYTSDTVDLRSKDDLPTSEDFEGNKVCTEIYDRLLLKEHWKSNKYGVNRLLKYIEIITRKVQHNIENMIEDGYVLNSTEDCIVINTGLLDNFMSDIYICFDISGDLFHNPSVVDNKAHLIKKGFSRDKIKVMPSLVKFYEKASDLVFIADIDDFDIDDSNRLDHIINERRERFPESYKDIPSNVICNKLRTSIEQAIKISQRDYKYIVPMYNINSDSIQFLIPLHLDNSIEEIPELVLVVSEYQGFYTVKTILRLSDAYDNARIISRPGNSWLQLEDK